jgi:hypothetical protein
LTASANGTQRRMPAKVGEIKSKGETCLQQILAGLNFVWLVIDIDCHFVPLSVIDLRETFVIPLCLRVFVANREDSDVCHEVTKTLRFTKEKYVSFIFIYV